jgi:hypothetical protein
VLDAAFYYLQMEDDPNLWELEGLIPVYDEFMASKYESHYGALQSVLQGWACSEDNAPALYPSVIPTKRASSANPEDSILTQRQRHNYGLASTQPGSSSPLMASPNLSFHPSVFQRILLHLMLNDPVQSEHGTYFLPLAPQVPPPGTYGLQSNYPLTKVFSSFLPIGSLTVILLKCTSYSTSSAQGLLIGARRQQPWLCSSRV